MSLLRRSKLFWVAASFILHAVFMAVFFLFSKPVAKPREITEIEFQSTPVRGEAPVRGRGANSKSGALTKNSTVPSASASSAQLGEKILLEGSKVSMEKAGTAVISGETVFGEGAAPVQGNGQWVEQVGFKQGLELTTFFHKLLGKLDRGLAYPLDMAKQRIQGEVRVDLYVNKKGQLVGDFHSVSGGETLLKLYVMSALLVILKDPLSPQYWAETEEKIALSIHVRFETYQFSEMAVRDSVHFNSNELNVVRTQYVVPMAVEKTREFFTHYVPPIIPIPGGFYVDLILLAEYIQNIGEPLPEDKRKQRLNLTREQLERAIGKKRDIKDL